MARSFKLTENTWLFIVLLFVLAIMIGVGASKVPALWFDESWTLCVARNWINENIYAIKVGNEWVSAIPMAHAFSVTVPVIMSFRLFGVGVLQGRLPNILFSFGIFVLVFNLVRKIYGSRMAWVTLLIILFFVPQLNINPILFGRQVLAETPMLFYLLLGNWFWLQAIRGSKKSVFITPFFWGLALISKENLLPFWLASMLVPMGIAVMLHEKQMLKLFGIVFLLTGLVYCICVYGEAQIVGDWPAYGSFPLTDVFNLAIWAWAWKVRIGALFIFLKLGMFSLLGIFLYTNKLIKRIIRFKSLSQFEWFEISWIIITATWSFWFLFGSLGWPRYYYPIFILSAVFYAGFLLDWTQQFKQLPTLKLLQDNRMQFWKSLVALIMIIINVGFVIRSISYISDEAESGIYQVAKFFRTRVKTSALVETYDSELLFLLKQPIHYPPDNVQLALNLRKYVGKPIQISYDPLTANPEYLVVGPLGNEWQLYKAFIQSRDFLLIRKFPKYWIYIRNR